MIEKLIKSQNCKKYSNNQTISCKENKMQLAFVCNGRDFYQIHLDDDEEYGEYLLSKSRCDFIIVSADDLNDIALWIELKGSNLDKAFEQLLSAQEIFGQKIKQNYGAIVCSKVRKPKIDTIFANIRIKWKKKFGTNLFIATEQLKLKYIADSNSIFLNKN